MHRKTEPQATRHAPLALEPVVAEKQKESRIYDTFKRFQITFYFQEGMLTGMAFSWFVFNLFNVMSASWVSLCRTVCALDHSLLPTHTRGLDVYNLCVANLTAGEVAVDLISIRELCYLHTLHRDKLLLNHGPLSLQKSGMRKNKTPSGPNSLPICIQWVRDVL